MLKNFAEEGRAVYLPKFIASYPSQWDEFINYIDFCYQQSDPEQMTIHKEEFMKGGRVRRGFLQIWGYMTIFAENPKKEHFLTLGNIYEKIELEMERKKESSFAIVNMSSKENITNRHSDLTHNLYFQCIGSVIWKIYEDETSSNFEEYTLQPGDAIFVPIGVSHEVVSLSPRAAITVAFSDIN